MNNFEILSTEELLNTKGGKKDNNKNNNDEEQPKRANREFEMRELLWLEDCIVF